MAKKKQGPKPSESPTEAKDSNYTVLARRYRPQQFSDLVGQEHVAQALTNAVQSGRVAHAYLFTGSRGVGKTSTARILAKALNCEKGPTVTPCDKCNLCHTIAVGDDVDVLEIDGASNRGIDEVREIRQNVQYRPSQGRFKIFIIDEVHMLTPAAFNALLKTLEEPPPHVKFIFATTESQKIPITILSRCQRFDFAGISIALIVEQLKRILAGEGRQADDDALQLVARRAAGSMRDAESLLDQLLAFGSETLTAELVHSLLGTAHDDRVIELVDAVLAQDAKLALEHLGRAADQGMDLGELLNQLIDYWRDLMVVHCAGDPKGALSVGPSHHDTIGGQAKAVSLDSILAGLDILTAAKAKMLRGSQHGRVLIELALVRLSHLGDLVALSQMAQWLKNSQVAGAKPAHTGNSTRPGLSAAAPQQVTKKKETSASNAAPPIVKRELNAGSAPEIWAEALSQLPGLFKAQLNKIESVANSGPDTLVIKVSAQYNSLHEQLKDSERVSQIEKVLLNVTGRTCKVRIESTNNSIESTDVQAASPPKAEPARAQRPRADVVPLVKEVIELFDANIVKEDAGFGSDTNKNQE